VLPWDEVQLAVACL